MALIDGQAPLTASLCADHEDQLGHMVALVQGLSVDEFSQPCALGDAIGTHVRHVIEHYDGLLAGSGGPVDYENRARDPDLEHDPAAAVERINRIRATLERMPRGDGALEIVYTPADADEQERRTIGSSFARELHFLLSHTVHHMALIALLARQRGHAVPPGFGVARSTLRHRAAVAS